MKKLTKDQVEDLMQKLEAHIDDMLSEIKEEILNYNRETLSLWFRATEDENLEDYAEIQHSVDVQP